MRLRVSMLVVLGAAVISWQPGLSAAVVKKRDGATLDGKVFGLIVQRRSKPGSVTYTIRKGSDVLAIEASGIRYKKDSQVEVLTAAAEGLSADHIEVVAAGSGVLVLRVSGRTAAETVDTDPLIGEYVGNLMKREIKGAVLPTIRVETEAGLVTVPVAEVETGFLDVIARVGAASRLTDQTQLATIALEDPSPDVRSMAVTRLTDQSHLAEVAARDRNRDVRRKAVVKLTDHVLLAGVLKSIGPGDLESWVLSGAIKKLQGTALVRELALDARHPELRLAAAIQLMDLPLLTRMATADPDWEARLGAMKVIPNDQALFASIASTDRDPDVRSGALARLSDPQVMAEIAKRDPSGIVRRRAVVHLDDNALLAGMVWAPLPNQADVEARQYVHIAVWRMTDRALLTRIAETHPNPAVQASAKDRLAKLPRT